MKNPQNPAARLAALFVAASATFATAQLDNIGGTIVIEPGATLVVEGTIGGPADIDWPVQEPYGTALDNARVRSNGGERIEVGIVIPPMTMTCVPGPGGPTYHSGAASPSAIAIPAFIKFVRQSRTPVFVPVDLLLEVQNTEAGPADADLQVIDTEILSMSLSMQAGNHPYFSSLSCVAQAGGTGRTTLRRFLGDQFHVDSFFDIVVEISATGAPGEAFDGVVINDSAPMRLLQTLNVFDGVRFSPLGDARIIDDGTCLQVDNLGSSGLDGVRISPGGGGHGKDDDCDGIALNIEPSAGGSGLLADGETMSMYPFPPPPTDFPDLPALPSSTVLTNSGGVVSGVCTSNGLGASSWSVEVWNGDVLVASTTAADGAVCYSVPASLFNPKSVRVSAFRGHAGNKKDKKRAPSTTVVMTGAVAVTVAGASTPVVGDRVVCSPRDPQILPGFVSSLELRSSTSAGLCITALAITKFEIEHSGLDQAVLSSTAGGGLRVSNLGSSGSDGVSISIGGPDDDCDDACLPYEADLVPLAVQGSGGSFFTSAHDVNGVTLIEAEYRDSNLQGGPIYVLSPPDMSVCRVTVNNNGQYVGEFDVQLTVGAPTQVCVVGVGAIGPPLLTGCGKRALGWPWELSCLVQEFDRPIPITPTGGSPLVGDEVLLLLPEAGPASVDALRTIQMRASGISEFEICDGSKGSRPPDPVLTEEDHASFDYPGTGSRMSDSVPKYITSDNAKTICIFSSLKDIVKVAEQNNLKTYTATLQLDIEGVDGLSLSRSVDLPGNFVIEHGPNPFSSQDVQQFGTQVRSCVFTLPAGDPDFSLLRVGGGTDSGFPSPGDVIISKVPECVFIYEEIQKILAGIVITGTPGGGLTGGRVLGAAFEQNLHIDRPDTRYGGLASCATGVADLSVGPTGLLKVSNLGSSGSDGVSIALPDVESCSVEFSAALPVDLQPGGVFTFEPSGSVRGFKAGASLSKCVVSRTAGPDSFFDIFTEFSALAPTGTTIEVYDAGLRVLQVPGGATSISVEAHATTTGLSPIKACGKLNGRSATPCNFIRFCNPVIFRVNGQPDVVGDEVRLLVHGVPFVSVSSLALTFADTAGDVEIAEVAMGVAGRDIVMGGGSRATDYNSSRSNRTTSIAFDPDPDDDNDGVDGYIEMRAPRSVFLPGQFQLWPLSCVLDPFSPVFGEVGASMKFEAFGTINGEQRASYGVLEACTDGEKFLLKGDFTSRGNAEVCIRVSKEIDKATPLLAEAVVLSGGTYAEIRPLRGGGAFPLGRVSAVPELYEPPNNQIECSYTLHFAEPVEVTLPGQAPVIGTDIEIQLVAPTFVSENVHSLRISGHGFKPFIIDGIGTGPFYGQGLVNTTLGGAQIEEQTPGDRGHLVVSNIGSSGQDGVSIDLDEGEGVWQSIAPLNLDLSGEGRATLGLSLVEPCLGTFEDCEKLAQLRVVSDGNPLANDELEWLESAAQGARVVGTSGGVFRGSVSVGGDGSTILVGSIGPQGGGSGSVIGYGLLPPTVLAGYGPLPACIAVRYDSPMVFIPAGGGSSFVFDTLCFDAVQVPAQSQQKRLLQFDVQVSGVPQMEVENTELFHLNRLPHQSLGVAELIAVDGALIVRNIGLSGQDGVRARTGRNPQTGKEIQIAAKSVVLQTPPPTGGFPTLTAIAHGALNGVPDQTLGESRVTMGSESNIIPLAADFSSLGAPQVRVIVCIRGEDCDDSLAFVTPSGPVATTEVCRLLTDGGLPPAVIGCGKLRERVIPGGQQAPCFYWDFDRPFEVVAPGGLPGSGVVGDRILLLAHGATQAFDTEIVSLDLRSSGLADLTLLPANAADSFFDIWLELNFTPTEIAALDAAGYDLDLDNDGFSETAEFILGFDPGVPDSPTRGIGIAMGSVAGPGGETEQHVRISFEFDPEKQGVSHSLGISAALDEWDYSGVAPDMIVAPDMWRLIEINPVQSGNQRYTFERTDPVGAHTSEYYRYRGHVTVLK